MTAEKNGAKKALARRSVRAHARARDRFIRRLAESGNVAAAARKARIPGRTLYDWKKADPEFEALWKEAEEIGIDIGVKGEVHRRAIAGVAEPVFQGGKKVGTVKRYSDRLLEILLKGHRPQYRENAATMAVQVNTGGTMSSLDRDAQILEAARGVALLLSKAGDIQDARALPAPAEQSDKPSPPYESVPAEPAGMKQSTEPEADPADDPDPDVTRGMAELDRADRRAEGEVGMHIRQQESRRPTVVNTARRPWPWRGRR